MSLSKYIGESILNHDIMKPKRPPKETTKELSKCMPSPDQSFIDIIRAAKAKSTAKSRKHPVMPSDPPRRPKASSSTVLISTSEIIDLTFLDSDSDDPITLSSANRFQSAFERAPNVRPESSVVLKLEPVSPTAPVIGIEASNSIGSTLDHVEKHTESVAQFTPRERLAQAARPSASYPQLLANTVAFETSAAQAIASKSPLRSTSLEKSTVSRSPLRIERGEEFSGLGMFVPEHIEQSGSSSPQLLSKSNHPKVETREFIRPPVPLGEGSTSPVPPASLPPSPESNPSALDDEAVPSTLPETALRISSAEDLFNDSEDIQPIISDTDNAYVVKFSASDLEVS